ncbi:acid phosphatase/Vanadium-dependent haloperoxidase [Anaeromyces robustus]|jgi:diacylglycerol diphosphate phosphatase/phosphatidate phosphatase|uniref:Acid phosphatase/Vanadium-dependent haloperoxidase n=1 Tax=Anaeromyces robustus TaxID=1754192 RepID=A0A1Y1WQZ2_9FUNG|nr:acid phosphatase/Vanadium-dependent haloperoxidase [Anaeromyces robustus]|eukprot:ORX75953.1 acid phosphatase/Vanadium-dependent haloperoxidase [Anaeromyces robustus]
MALFKKEIKTDNKALKILFKILPIAFDWLIIYFIWEIKAFIYSRIDVFERKFSIYDESISYPYKKPIEKVNWYTLLHYTLTICSIIIVIIQLLKCYDKVNYGINNLHLALLGLFLSYLITNTFVDYIKNFAGRYRPDFLTVCDVDFKKVEEQFQHYRNLTGGVDIENYGPRNLFDTSICRCDRSEIPEEQKSFPSGHTAFAFSTMVYISLYFAGQLHMFKGKCPAWKILIVCVPFFASFYVPFTRVSDYRHHWEDVLAGAIIGSFFAVIVYYLMYPKLTDPDCDIPYRGDKRKEKKVKVDELEEDDLPQEQIV